MFDDLRGLFCGGFGGFKPTLGLESVLDVLSSVFTTSSLGVSGISYRGSCSIISTTSYRGSGDCMLSCLVGFLYIEIVLCVATSIVSLNRCPLTRQL